VSNTSVGDLKYGCDRALTTSRAAAPSTQQNSVSRSNVKQNSGGNANVIATSTESHDEG
jgi:hypothetical protein